MKKIVVLAQKGGSGKTTLAIHLAVAAGEAGERVCLIDTDPQGSSYTWAEQRQAKTPLVASASPAELPDVFSEATKIGATFAVIDTAPHATADATMPVSMADFVLIPCRPTVLDIAAASRTVSIVNAAQKPAAFILSQCPSRALEIPEVRRALSRYSLPIIPVMIGFRASYARALASGRAVTEFEGEGKAAQEIRILYKWIKSQRL